MWFLNSAMLLGLVSIALPVLAHLLSQKKYDVVPWGAMQFLALGRNTQRRVRLEEMYLMCVRMLLLALLALALSRPWMSAGWISGYRSTEPRDVVLVIDGSTSMGWEGRPETPHAAAVQFAHRFLEELRGGDTVAILEARDVVRSVLTPAVSDFRQVRQALDQLPAPGGSSDLVEATSQAFRLLNSSANLARDVIVMTDLQARGWAVDDVLRWEFLDEQRRQPSIKPRLWVVDVGAGSAAALENFSLDQIQVSREYSPPQMPLRIQTRLRHFGGQEAVARQVFLEVDGQRLATATLQSPPISPGGEFQIEFQQVLSQVGSHLISVVIDDDGLPHDNRAEVAVEIAPPLDVLAIDGAPHADPTRSETFFIRLALGSGRSPAPLVQCEVQPPSGLTSQKLEGKAVAILANVPDLTADQVSALQAFVDQGGGLWIALGNQVKADFYNRELYREGTGLLPATLEKIEQLPASPGQQDTPAIIQIDNPRLELPWLQPFRKEHQGGLTEARFDHWWKVTPRPGSSEGLEPATGPATTGRGEVIGWLSNGAPWLIEQPFGQGRVLLMCVPLDSDWSTLPAKPDYVPFLHESLFHLSAGSRVSRNVQVGEPLVVPVTADFLPKEYHFAGPGKTRLPVTLGGDEVRPLARLDDTSVPGVYRLRAQSDQVMADQTPPYVGVVNFDRRESDLTPLSDAQRGTLQQEGRSRIVNSMDELRREMFATTARAELWQWLLLGMLMLLVYEVWLTRRLVQGGHSALDRV